MAELPKAALLGPKAAAYGSIERFAHPPSWARTFFSWAMTGAFAGAAGNILAAVIRAGVLGEVRMLGSIGIIAGGLLGSIALILPFLLCGGLYAIFAPKDFERERARSPLRGALWGMSFHALGHLAVVSWFLGVSWHAHLEVPLLVGAIWGLWLPRVAIASERR